MCPIAENKLSINIVIFIKTVLFPSRRCFICGDDPGKCKSCLVSLSSSFTYDESDTYGTQLENGTWIGMVGQVKRQVRIYVKVFVILVILHPSFVRDTIRN